MIVVRDVFQARYGRGGELVALFKEAYQQWPTDYATRVLTDASGTFFTVVTETEFEDLGAWQAAQAEYMAMDGFGDWFERMVPLVESGRREFYNVEM